VSGFHRELRGLAAPGIGDFQVVTSNQAVIPLGVSEAFEGESGLCHTIPY
jgi:hypothetical protein